MGGEELKWRQLAHHQLMSLILVHRVKLKPVIKAQISGRMVSSISQVAFASVYSEKTCMKKLDYDNYYYYRNDVFWWSLEIDFRYETKARKVKVDFKFDALYS